MSPKFVEQLARSVGYGNHSSTRAHEGLAWETLKEGVRRGKALILDIYSKVVAAEIEGFWLSLLGGVITRRSGHLTTTRSTH